MADAVLIRGVYTVDYDAIEVLARATRSTNQQEYG
jgi:hypothetical protein